MDILTRPADRGWRAYARFNLNTGGHDLWVAWRSQDGKSFAASLELVESNGLPSDAPTIADASGWSPESVGGDVRGFLQCMVDTAWEAGVRPTKLAEHQSELTAVRYHLEDMRALAKVPVR